MTRVFLGPLLLALWGGIAALSFVIATPDPHAAHAQGTSTCAHDASRWHPPVDPATGCVYGHEHGDQPPPWIAAAGYQAGFDAHGGFHGNTTAQENVAKHRSMKAMHATFGNQEVYLRLHFASNVLERMSRDHSYEMFLRDAAGNVSHYQGWTNTGNPDPNATQTGRVSKVVPDPGYRPIVLVPDLASLQRGFDCETWYATTSTWGPEFGWTICGSTTMYFPEEAKYTDYEFPLCDYGYPKPTCLGSNRELELSLYVTGSKNAPTRGDLAPKDVLFYATQFGDGVAGGLADPKCALGATTTRFGQAYQNTCLEQYVASTARAIENLPNVPGANRFRKDYDVTGVGFPN
jgi:hypothetical protein